MLSIPYKKMPTTRYNDALEFLSKWGAFIAYVSIGIVGKIGFDIISKKKITYWYVAASSAIAFFVGFVVWQYIKDKPQFNPGIYLPIAALVSRDIMLFITMVNWMGLLQIVFQKSLKNKDNK